MFIKNASFNYFFISSSRQEVPCCSVPNNFSDFITQSDAIIVKRMIDYVLNTANKIYKRVLFKQGIYMNFKCL
tara:strand:- start:13905 stop:14123 length:219 start_codon:yes stop_codon:yes gene_type:complete